VIEPGPPVRQAASGDNRSAIHYDSNYHYYEVGSSIDDIVNDDKENASNSTKRSIIADLYLLCVEAGPVVCNVYAAFY
jgi:hypothetical protein